MAAATALQDVAPATLKAGLERNDAILVDKREADEYAREHIPGARPHPFSRRLAAPLPRVPGKKLVLQCNSGNRTRQAAAAIRARAGQEARAPLQQQQPDAPGWSRCPSSVPSSTNAPRASPAWRPFARDSGQHRGQRSIRGGRAPLRQALHLPALVAVRFEAAMKAEYHALRAAGKPPKVALIAIMRKLVILANALLRDGRTRTPDLA